MAVGALALGSALACTDPTVQPKPEGVRPPNIILVLADDLGWGDLRAYDQQSPIPTPNIDRLASEGVRFTDAHSPSAVCSPTRYGILTGRYAWRTRLDTRVLRYFDPPLIEPDRLTMPEMLRRRGYATAAIGKWHLGLNVPTVDGQGFARLDGKRLPAEDPDFSAAIQGGPLDLGFDSYFGAQLARVRAFVRDRHFIGRPVRGPADKRFRVPDWDEAQKGPIQLTEALDTIQRLHDGDPQRPFFLYYASQAPHTPYVAAPEVAGVPVAGTSGAGARGDLVVELDVVVGQLIRRLDELDIAEETLIVLTSDNGAGPAPDAGGHDPTGGWRGEKGGIWEGGHRIPLIARWGDGTANGSVIRAGRVSDSLVGLQDLMATVADLIGEPLPADAAEDSESFLPSLLDRPDGEPGREHLVHHSATGRFAIRRGDWKLILAEPNRPPGPAGRTGARLFNLADDPGETENLYQRYPEVVAELRALLERDRDTAHSARRLRPGQST